MTKTTNPDEINIDEDFSSDEEETVEGQLCQMINYLPSNKINVTYKMNFVIGNVENIVGKGENAGYQHFLLFPQCFQKASFSKSLKVGIVWESFIPLPYNLVLSNLKKNAFEKIVLILYHIVLSFNVLVGGSF